jgi:hypothetical protein
MARSKRSRWTATIALFAVGLVIGCSDTPTGRLRVVHLSQKLPVVDIGFDGERRARGLAYGDSSRFLVVGVGVTNVLIVPNDGSSALVDHELDIEEGSRHTLFVVDRGNNIEVIAERDTRQNPDARAELRVVYSTAAGDPLRLLFDNTPLIDSIDPNTVTPYASLDSGERSLKLISNLTDRTALALQPTALRSRGNYTLAVFDPPAKSGETLVAKLFADDGDFAPIEPALEDARVRMIHVSPGADAIRGFVAGKALSGEPLAFLENSDYQTVPAGSQTLELKVATGNTTIYSKGPRLSLCGLIHDRASRRTERAAHADLCRRPCRAACGQKRGFGCCIFRPTRPPWM